MYYTPTPHTPPPQKVQMITTHAQDVVAFRYPVYPRALLSEVVTMSSTEAQEREMREKAVKESETATDPIEKLRNKLLSRGSNSIKGMGR